MRLAPTLVAVTATALLAACGGATNTPSSSSSSAGGGGSTSAASTPTASSAGGGAAAAYTVMTTNIPGLGEVLVNGNGKTLYVLSTEKNGNVTCTASNNGCTGVWPDMELPSGVTAAVAGSGVQGSMVGTVTGGDGTHRVTYATYPLYTYSGDAGPGKATGVGLQSFGGTWSAIGPDGSPVSGSGGNGGY